MRFRTVVQQSGKSATGIEVPAAVVDGLGAGKRPKVRVTINGYTYQSSVGVMNGRSLIPVSAAVRGAAGVAAGEEVDVHVEVDTAPREVVLPDDFAAALNREPAARKHFDTLSYSNQRWHLLQIEGAKSATTRQRRIKTSVAVLASGQNR
jgi:hypothetical protein